MSKFATVEDYIAALPEHQRTVAHEVSALIEKVLPGAGAVWHGHPVWSLGDKPGKSPVCLIKAYPNHVTFGFWRGQRITDPSGRLSPGSREMASVKLRAVDDIDTDLFLDWLTQARNLELGTAS